MRPTYETAQDGANEKQVIDLLCRSWGCSAAKTPRFYPVDWSLQKEDEVKAMAEIKFRKKSYPTYIISLHKYVEMCQHAAASGLPYLLVVCWPEGLKRIVRYISIKPDIPKRVIHGGRKDRGDTQDMEPMCEIPMSKFSLVGEL
jgi:hypothetical protein